MTATETLLYDGPGGPFEGTISRPTGAHGDLPGILVVHAYGGQGVFDTQKAEELAEQGYVAFAIDLYGVGRRGANQAQSATLMAELTSDRPLLRKRMAAALDNLRAQAGVDRSKTAAIGFCFGGLAVLDLARDGSDVSAVASFHGVYAPADLPSKPISAKVLVLHGWDDPLDPPETTVALARELDGAGADWEICAYGGTGHAFTNPGASSHETGMAYHPRNARRAWQRLLDFLGETFEPQP